MPSPVAERDFVESGCQIARQRELVKILAIDTYTNFEVKIMLRIKGKEIQIRKKWF
jgi:hypothetical protein